VRKAQTCASFRNHQQSGAGRESSPHVGSRPVSSQRRRTQTALTVVSAQPAGEIGALGQAAELRIRFSEPMIPLGRIDGEWVGTVDADSSIDWPPAAGKHVVSAHASGGRSARVEIVVT
jgi:hypothetical protein